MRDLNTDNMRGCVLSSKASLVRFCITPCIACSLLLVLLLSCSIPPPAAAATYRAGGRHSPTRSRPNFPLKTFPKIIRDFSAIESGVRPPLGRKLAPHSTGGKAKKCRKMKSQDGGGSVVAVVPRNCNSLKTANSKCVFVAQWTRRNDMLQRRETKILSHDDGNIFPEKKKNVTHVVDWTYSCAG